MKEEKEKIEEDEDRLHNVVKVEFWIDCGNCTMNKDERAWYIEKITDLCEIRASKLKDIKIYN